MQKVYVRKRRVSEGGLGQKNIGEKKIGYVYVEISFEILFYLRLQIYSEV